MSCDAVRELLPDYTLGTLSETESAAVRRHLRGCGACRKEADRLDHGVALFASAAHEAEPPPELKDRVMRVLAEEWTEAPDFPRVRRPITRGLVLALAAAFVVIAGAVAWGAVNQVRANHFEADATSLHNFLATLGGRDVRAGKIVGATRSNVQGNVVAYDAERGMGQSWALVDIRAPGLTGEAFATLRAPNGESIKLFPIQIDRDGEGWTGLFTATDLSEYTSVRVVTSDGKLLASGHSDPPRR